MVKELDIAIRIEGGMGDCLYGTRFVPAILEKYPNSRITAYLDTEGNNIQEDTLKLCYSYLYKEIITIPNKKYKELWIDSQFGPEEYKGGIENCPDEYIQKFKNYDKFYNLHLDSLDWVDFDFDWLRYFNFFPTPRLEKRYEGKEIPDKFIALHLTSESSTGHRLEKFYINYLVKELIKFAPVVIISTPKTNHFYSDISKLSEVKVINFPLWAVFDIIKRSSLLIATDSGMKPIAYGFNIPTLEFSAQCQSPHNVIPSHRIRWNIFPERVLPLNYDAKYVSNCAKRIYDDKSYSLLPFITDADNQLIRRKYSVNFEKSVLNE